MVTAKIKNSDINQESEKANAVRIAVPVDQTIPDYPLNLALYAFFEQAMFVFDNVLDKDVTSYEYELYKSDQVTGSFPNYSLINNPTIYLSGESSSNVFAVAVENSTDTTTIRYYGRVRTKDTSNNYSSWSPLVLSDQDTPLIGNQYVASLTAAKITAGTIGAHQIVLSQAGAQTNIAAPANMAILRSSDYNGSYDNGTSSWTNGTSGWVVAGDGHAEFSSASIRGGLKAGSVYINADNRWRRNSSDTSSSSEFKVGSNDKYLYFDGTDLTFTGNLSAAGGTFTGALSGGTIDIGGSDATSFHVDIEGNMWLGAGVFADGTFRVTKEGDAYANSLITNKLNLSGDTELGNNGKIFLGAGNFNNDDTPFYVDSDSQFSLGTKLVWNGSALTVRGNLKLEDGSLAINKYDADEAAEEAVEGFKDEIYEDGFIGGLTINATKMFFGQGLYNNENTAFYVGKNNSTGQADFSLGDKLTWDGTDLTIKGNITATSGTFAGNLSAAGGTFTGTLSVGSVRVGDEAINSGSPEKGISISGAGLSQWNNAWIQRTDNSVYFKAGNTTRYIQLDTSGNNEIKFPNFSVNNEGSIVATNADITGRITATSGTISGDLVTGGTIKGTTIDIGNGTFLVNSDGSMAATNADIKGTIRADAGLIGGWTIHVGHISGGGQSNGVVTTLDPNGNNQFGNNVDAGGRVTAHGQVDGIGILAKNAGIKANDSSIIGGKGISYPGPGVASANFVAFQWDSPKLYGIIDNVQPVVVGIVSDIRFKKNIVDAEDIYVQKLLNNLRIVEFNSYDPETDRTNMDLKNIGVVAQEAIEAFPDIVKDVNKDGSNQYALAVDYVGFVPYLIKTVQYLSNQINNLTTRLTLLESN